MRNIKSFILLGLLSAVFLNMTAFGQEGETVKESFLWIGGHYTDYEDYMQKVGEYSLGEKEDFLPSFGGSHAVFGEGYRFFVTGYYHDDKNISGQLKTSMGDRLSADVRYRSFNKLAGTDLLENLETREAGGGKILTHEVMNPDAEYYTHRRELETNAEALLSRNYNLKLMVAHRTVLKSGVEQKIANNHCFSCHITSNSAEVDKVAHHIVAKLQGEFGGQTVGYEVGYRQFKSEAPDAYGLYDEAKHPVTGLSGGEFSSRLNYDDGNYIVGQYPETRKVSHRVRLKGNVGKAKYAGSIGYSETINEGTDIGASALIGSLNWAMPLGQKSRLIAKLAGIKYDVDSTFVDLPLWRLGRPGPERDFDYARLSTLDRTDIRGSLEYISKLSRKLTGSLLLGLDYIDRTNYPNENLNNTTRFILQAKGRYRKGLRYSTSVKYRLEMTDKPFTSNRGIFERSGRDELNPVPETFRFVFYWQREDLRYQNITTEPTMEHLAEWSSTWRPNKTYNVNLGLKFNYDQNSDLDSLDIEHMLLQPHVALNITPDPKFNISAGFSYQHYKSRGPIAVALFDG